MARTKIFSGEDTGKYQTLDYAYGRQCFPTELLVARRRLGSEWPGGALVLDGSDGHGRRHPDMAWMFYALALPVDLCSRLNIREGPSIELLEVQVGSEPWVLVNALMQVASFDAKTSNFDATDSSDPTGYNFRWINTTDRHARVVELFALPQARNRPVFTESLVDRIQAAGIRGLKFEHVGYIVDDVSEAVPPPPPKPMRPSKPRKTKPLTLHALPRDEVVDIDAHLNAWLATHGLAPDAGSDAVLNAFGAQVEAARPGNSERSDDDWIALLSGLGAAYGDLICRTLGWHWALLRMGRDISWVVVASPAQTHALAPAPFVRGQLDAPISTHALLYNMLQAGQLPPAQAGTVVTVG